MATHKIGKLKFRLQDGGLDLRWGDGEIRRLGLKKKTENQDYEDQYAENYDDMNEAEDMDSAGYYDEQSGYEDYSEDGYADGYDEEYPEEEYEDDGYGEYADEYDSEYDDYEEEAYEEYDDGYADGYEDDYGYDEEYDDGYDDGYDEYSEDDGYGEYAGEYADGYAEYPEGWLGSLIQYVDENDWVTYLLLFLLPPLGIYLLWRRQRFDKTMRYALSAASAVWFVVLLVLLFTVIFGGRSDDVYHGGVTLPPSAEPTMSVGIDATAAPDDLDTEATVEPVVQPSPTPIGGGGAAQTTGNLVWCSASGTLYHKTNTCEQIAAGESVTQVTLENAQSRNKYACPACHGEAVYYATAGGQYYHLDEHCSDMKNAVVYSKEQAVATGKSACPVCVSKTQQMLNAAGNDVKIITSSTTDKSGIRVWATGGGKYYHVTSNCSGMSGAVEGSLKDALLLGKAACPTCCKASGNLVYCTEGGTYYHLDNDCSGMVRAKHVTLAEALVLGKKQCNVCISTVSAGNEATSAEYYVYGTPTGKYYHINSTCSGMTGAQKVLLSYMLKINREACPVCCSGAEMTVYAAPGGSYYHSYATCSGMQNAIQGSLAQAMAMGYQRCTRCWGGSNSGETQSGSSGGASSALTNKDAADIMVYATQSGTYYHTKNNCSGMTGASHITLEVAMKAGKKACPTCASAALTGVYSTKGGKYYHKVSDCSGMRNATKRTLADALLLGQTACPTCLTMHVEDGDNAPKDEVIDNGSILKKVANYKSGTSGIKVYAMQTGSVFHTKSNCSGMKNASHITLETALNYGFEPCETCCASAAKTVYATKNGKYYHISRSCAGNGAVSGSLAQALAYGYTSCPYCVSSSSNVNNNTHVSSDDFKVGASGVKVYSTVDGQYYHASKSCAGSGAVQVSLETALNYGKITCPKCTAFADRTVYAVAGKPYYHANRSCAGNDAIAGTYAYALAYGLKACPTCIGGSGAAGVTPGAAYSAPASTTVYVDLYSEEYYYHKSSKCSGAGMSSSTGVTLEFVKDLGYKRCPYCNPASSIA